MARRTIEITEDVNLVMAALAPENRGEQIAVRARALFDMALAQGASFEESLGIVYMRGITDAKTHAPAKRKRKSRAKSATGNGQEIETPVGTGRD